jgi:hypothetical protein
VKSDEILLTKVVVGWVVVVAGELVEGAACTAADSQASSGCDIAVCADVSKPYGNCSSIW